MFVFIWFPVFIVILVKAWFGFMGMGNVPTAGLMLRSVAVGSAWIENIFKLA